MKIIRDLFASKKFLVMLSSIVIYSASRFGLDVPPDACDKFLGLVAAWLVGQGVADHGKEAAKLSAGK